jgi:polyisoprenoid-binding protein YceI
MKTRSVSLAGVSVIALAAGAAWMGGWGSAPVAVLVSTAPAAAAAAAVSEGAFAVDAVHTSVVFRVQRVNGAPFYGRFDQISGSFSVEGSDGASGSLDITIPVTSVNSNNGNRDKHLRNADFFSAEEFPTATFKSTKFTAAGDKEWDVAGDLTIRGTTRPITARVKQTGTGPARGGGTMLGLDVQFKINRSEFGVNYGLQALGDEVQVMIGLEGVQK